MQVSEHFKLLLAWYEIFTDLQQWTRNTSFAAPIISHVDFGKLIYSSTNTCFDMLGSFDALLCKEISKLPPLAQRSAAVFLCFVLYNSDEHFDHKGEVGGSMSMFLQPLQRQEAPAVAMVAGLGKGRTGRALFIKWILQLVDSGKWRQRNRCRPQAPDKLRKWLNGIVELPDDLDAKLKAMSSYGAVTKYVTSVVPGGPFCAHLTCRNLIYVLPSPEGGVWDLSDLHLKTPASEKLEESWLASNETPSSFSSHLSSVIASEFAALSPPGDFADEFADLISHSRAPYNHEGILCEGPRFLKHIYKQLFRVKGNRAPYGSWTPDVGEEWWVYDDGVHRSLNLHCVEGQAYKVTSKNFDSRYASVAHNLQCTVAAKIVALLQTVDFKSLFGSQEAGISLPCIHTTARRSPTRERTRASVWLSTLPTPTSSHFECEPSIVRQMAHPCMRLHMHSPAPTFAAPHMRQLIGTITQYPICAIPHQAPRANSGRMDVLVHHAIARTCRHTHACTYIAGSANGNFRCTA